MKVHHVLPNGMSALSLWEHLELAFRDSSKSPIWPNEVETVWTDELVAGGTVETRERGAERHYRIIEWDPSAKRLHYETAEDHPLKGRATIEVRPTRDGCELIWDGDYETGWVSGWGLRRFERRFFRSLEWNLKRLYETPLRPTVL